MHRLPRFVTIDWIEQSWQEKTLLDEERMSTFGYLSSILWWITDFLARFRTNVSTSWTLHSQDKSLYFAASGAKLNAPRKSPEKNLVTGETD